MLAMFWTSNCPRGGPKINGRYQFEVEMQLKGRKTSQKRVRKCGYRASLNHGAPEAGCPLCPCQNWTPTPPSSQPPSHPAKVDWQTACHPAGSAARPKTLHRWKQHFCILPPAGPSTLQCDYLKFNHFPRVVGLGSTREILPILGVILKQT